MKLNVFGGVAAVILVVMLIIAYMSVFTVYQTQQALVVRLGDPIRTIPCPGCAARAINPSAAGRSNLLRSGAPPPGGDATRPPGCACA